MPDTAFWRALYTGGHDAALLAEHEDGWRLDGTAVFLHDDGPACVRYVLELNADWSTRSGRVTGFVGTRPFERRIERDAEGWMLDGVRQQGLDGVVDLDLGFTPATNKPQLMRMALEIGQSAEIIVAWLDVESTELIGLPQLYRREGNDAYAYDSPQGPYRATLRTAPNGFVRDYPDLWVLEAHS